MGHFREGQEIGKGRELGETAHVAKSFNEFLHELYQHEKSHTRIHT